MRVHLLRRSAYLSCRYKAFNREITRYLDEQVGATSEELLPAVTTMHVPADIEWSTTTVGG